MVDNKHEEEDKNGESSKKIKLDDEDEDKNVKGLKIFA